MYNLLRKSALVILAVFLLLFVVYFILKLVLDKKQKPEFKNIFEERFYNYLTKNDILNSKKGYLITGDWGSGKTYFVNNFFEKHFKFYGKPIYKISCFGLDSREAVVQEIEKQIENNDNSMINWIQYIPFIGLPIFGLLKKSYSLQSISSKSIFIFDDFERITSLGIETNQPKFYYDRKEIARNERVFGSRNEFKEFKEINKEFEKVQKNFNALVRERDFETTHYILQKYNIVTGLINELIENNDVKVIIVCNTSIIGSNYMNKVFRGKLDCITYNISTDKLVIMNVFNNVIDNFVLSDNTKNTVQEHIGELIEDFNPIWSNSRPNNLREVKSFFQAFIETINLIGERSEISKGIIYSLFYSIYSIFISNNDIDGFIQIPTGSNLLFYLIEHKSSIEYAKLGNSRFVSDIRWIGWPLAGGWLFNIDSKNSIDESIRCFNSYLYSDVEWLLFSYNNLEEEEIKKIEIGGFNEIHFRYVLEIDKNTDKTFANHKKSRLVVDKIKSKLPSQINNCEGNLDDTIVSLLTIIFKCDLSATDYNIDKEDDWFEIIYTVTGFQANNTVTGFQANNNVTNWRVEEGLKRYRSFVLNQRALNK